MFFVGRLGPDAQAAVGMGSQMVILLALSMAVTTGATAIVARYVGAGDGRTAADAAKQSLLLAMALAALVGCRSGTPRTPILLAMGAPEVLGPQQSLLGLTLLAIVPYFILLTFSPSSRVTATCAHRWRSWRWSTARTLWATAC